jgi:DNA-binding transcriptional LysR family regulator
MFDCLRPRIVIVDTDELHLRPLLPASGIDLPEIGFLRLGRVRQRYGFMVLPGFLPTSGTFFASCWTSLPESGSAFRPHLYALARVKKSPLASLNSHFSRSTSSATGGVSLIWPMPCPEPQMSRQALTFMLPPEPKFILVLSATDRLFGSSPAAAIEGPRGSSHPTVGREISALETQLGTKLFARSNDGLVLTEQGHRFREHTAAMETAALRAEAAVSAKGQKARGIVRFSIGPTLATYWLMPHMASFIAAHPDVQIEFVTHPFPVSVRKREADIVLRVYQSGDENLVGRKLARLGVGFYASRHYAARHRLPTHRHEWKHHSVIGFADRASNAELGRWSDHVTKQASIVMRCSSQTDMLAAVRAGIGICAMSCIASDAHDDLIRVAPDKLVGLSDIWLMTHPDLIDLPAVRAVINFFTQRARRSTKVERRRNSMRVLFGSLATLEQFLTN